MSALVLAALLTIDDALAHARVPSLSPYWRGEVERWYSHHTARELVEEVGRGGGKNLTSLKMALAEVLTGDFVVPPGERHFFVHVAENKDEASKDRRQFEQYLAILGVPFDASGDAIELRDMPRGFRVLAARVGAVSGWRCIGWTLNEAAKMNNDGVNPSAELAASMRAMTVQHAGARGRIISSPTTRSGFFWDCCERGDTETQLYGHAATWTANPSISEAQTRRLEPDPRVWAREYAAIAQADALGVVDAGDVSALMRPISPSVRSVGREALFIDSSSGRGDGWSFCRAGFVADEGRAVVFVRDLAAFEGAFGREVSFSQVVAHVADIAKRHGVIEVFGDQYQSYSLESEFARYGLRFRERAWAQSSKVEAASALRRMLREQGLVLEAGPQADLARRELLSMQEKWLPSGALTVVARRTGAGHSDRASLLLLIARCVADGDLRGVVAAQGADAHTPGARPMVIKTQFTSFGGFQNYGERPPAPRPEGPQQVAVRNLSTGEVRTYQIPQAPAAPAVVGGGRGGGNRGWGSGW